MIRCDGDFVIYILECRDSRGKWFGPNYDNLGTPKGFAASDDCWQATGVSGTFHPHVGLSALQEMAKKHTHLVWRLMKMTVSQHKREIASMHLGGVIG